MLIMDLRANGGGYLPEAESLTGLFIDRGPVVQLRDTTGRVSRWTMILIRRFSTAAR